MAINIRPHIIINGKSSQEVSGLMICSLPPITKPQMRVSAQEIDGKDGDVVTELGFSAYDKEFSIALHGEYDVDEVIAYLNQSGKITFSNEPDKYYYFACYNGIDFEKLINYKTADVEYHVQPFKFSLSEGEKAFTFEASAESGELTIRNNGNYISRPKLKITGSGAIQLGINGNTLFSVDMSEESEIIMDGADMNAYNPEGLLMNRKITGNMDNLWLAIGKNTIDYSGSITEIVVSNQSRWI